MMNGKSAKGVYQAFKDNNTSEILYYCDSGSNARYWQEKMQQELGGSGYPFLIWAVKNGNYAVTQKLTSFGESVDMIDTNNNFSCLMLALHNGHLDIAKLLLNYSANVNYRREDRRSALSIAAEKNRTELFEEILKKVKNPSDENTTLDVICKNSDRFPFYDMLVKAGAKTGDMVSQSGAPALHLAAAHGNDKVFDALLNAKDTRYDMLDKSGYSALYYAIQQYPDKPYFDHLIEKKCGLQDREVYIYIADRPALLPLLERIAAAGATPEKAIYSGGHTLLHKTVTAKNERMVDFLLARGADPNMITNDKQAPLHLAAKAGSLRMATSLLEKGACLDEKDKNGYTPYDFAKNGNFLELATFLEEAAAGVMPAKKAPIILAPANDDDSGEQWQRVNRDCVAHVLQLDGLGKRITEIFNFKSHDRLTIVDDMRLKQQNTLPRESFDMIEENTLKEAFGAYEKMDGKISRADAIDGYPGTSHQVRWTK